MTELYAKRPNARIAGFCYLLLVLTGFFTLAYIPAQLEAGNNPAAVVQKMAASKTLLRLGIVCGAVCYLSYLFLAFFLYRVFYSVHPQYTRLMALLVVVSIPISFVNLQNQLSILSLLDGEKFLQGLSAEQIQTQVLVYQSHYSNGIAVAGIFWGLWLLPFGYMVFRSGLMPKVLGILLMLGCLAYMVDFFVGNVFPGYAQSGISRYLHIPGSLGEIGSCLWLLIVGVNTLKKTNETIR